MLTIYGVCLGLSYGISFLDPGSGGFFANVNRWQDRAWKVFYLTGPLVPLAGLATGLCLLVAPSKPLSACALVLLVCAVARTVVTATMLGWGCWMAREPLVALAFLVFVLAYRPRGDPTNPTCSTCGYSLRGLPTTGHRCPECGREFTLPAPPPTAKAQP